MGNPNTSYAQHGALNLLDQAQGFAGPGSPLYQGFQSQLNTDLSRQGADYGAAFGGYSDFAKTGGFTPESEQQFLRRGTEGVTSTYNALEDQAKRANVATGGLGTGGGIAQIARQLGQAQSGATLNSQVALNEMKNQNKLSGLGGLTNLFDINSGQVTAAGKNLLNTLGLDFATQGEALSILQKLSQNKGVGQTLFEDILAAAKVASGAAGAFGGGGGGGTNASQVSYGG